MNERMRLVELDSKLLDEAEKAADLEGLGLRDWLDRVVAERLSNLKSEEYFAVRRTRANLSSARQILAKAGSDGPVQEGDEIL